MQSRRMTMFLLSFLLSVIVSMTPEAAAQTSKAGPQTTVTDNETGEAWQAPGFVDQDGDGVNDYFRDTDGDGKNDVTGLGYPHGFSFLDENRDGSNDLWSDADGDGVNDLLWMFDKKDRGSPEMFILDREADGVNDVTDRPYNRDDYSGADFGFVDENAPDLEGPMIDEDGNGLDDRLEKSRMRRHGRDRDVFVDEDGDGICDGRGDALRRGGRHGQGYHGGGHHR